MVDRSAKTLLSLASILVLCAMFSGCGSSSVTRANFGKIKQGMPQQEVEGLLGKPTESKKIDTEAVLHDKIQKLALRGSIVLLSDWKDGSKMISVGFLNGKVTYKEWRDGSEFLNEPFLDGKGD